MLNRAWKIFKENAPEILLLIFSILFSCWLMFSSFSSSNNALQISTRAWSDFSGHIPLIRSFSISSNFPPEYPLFPGEPIKYHFLYYFGVGMLEKIGIPIDLALNIPSIIGFTLLIYLIFLLGKMIFKSKAVGILSVIFFLFNSSLSYIYYFKNNSLSLKSIENIPSIIDFQSFAPYGQGIISAFWNLNVYTNQRHLAISFAISLIIIYFLLRPIFSKKLTNYKIAIILGLVLGLSFFLHTAAFLMTSIVILFLGIFFSKLRKNAFIILFLAAILAFPQYMYLNSSPGFKMIFNPGYLIFADLTMQKFIEFWIYNLGLSIVLILLGFIFSDWKQRKILLSFIPLFFVGNLIQFSPEIAANHKFFNYFILIGNMFSAFALYFIWKKNNLLKPLVIILTFFMIFGGIIDFFPLYNDHKISINDYDSDPDIYWIMVNTPKDSVFLNSSYLYNQASLAGRKVVMGWPYFAWSQGYNTDVRGKIRDDLFKTNDKRFFCTQSKLNNIDFVILNSNDPKADIDLKVDLNFFNNYFKPAYKNFNSGITIFSIKSNC